MNLIDLMNGESGFVVKNILHVFMIIMRAPPSTELRLTPDKLQPGERRANLPLPGREGYRSARVTSPEECVV